MKYTGRRQNDFNVYARPGLVVAKKMNFWKFARVAQGVQDLDCLVVSEQPPLAICGDYFRGAGGGSVGSFGGCVRSAAAAAKAINDLFVQLATTPAAALSQPRQIAPRPVDAVHVALTAAPTPATSVAAAAGIPAPRPAAASAGRPPPTTAVAASAAGGRHQRVLIVGGGISGALTAHLLKKGSPKLEVHCWEMARGAGGRMSTTRWGGKGKETHSNTGAQYVSAAADGPAAALVGEAVQAGLLEGPLANDEVVRHSRCFAGGGKGDFRATRGTSAVVKHFMQAADELHFETRLQSLQRQGGRGWLAVPNSRGKGGKGKGGGKSESRGGEVFDAVVLAMPPRDASRVTGDAQRVINGAAQHSSKEVQWTGRFSIALWWEVRDAADAAAFVSAASLAHQVVAAEASLLDAVVVQPPPPDAAEGAVVSVVIQSTSEYWARHSGVHAGGGRGGGRQAGGGASAGRPEQVSGNGRGAVQVEMLAALRALVKLPMPQPAHVKMLNWRTSQIRTAARTTAEDGACVVASRQPSLVLAGDWCTESSFEGCAVSAIAAVDAVRAALTAAPTTTTSVTAPLDATQAKPASRGQHKPQGKKRSGFF
jgi:predicted NAD/FAD-dependent oxidoreductase